MTTRAALATGCGGPRRMLHPPQGGRGGRAWQPRWARPRQVSPRSAAPVPRLLPAEPSGSALVGAAFAFPAGRRRGSAERLARRHPPRRSTQRPSPRPRRPEASRELPLRSARAPWRSRGPASWPSAGCLLLGGVFDCFFGAGRFVDLGLLSGLDLPAGALGSSSAASSSAAPLARARRLPPRPRRNPAPQRSRVRRSVVSGPRRRPPRPASGIEVSDGSARRGLYLSGRLGFVGLCAAGSTSPGSGAPRMGPPRRRGLPRRRPGPRPPRCRR